MFDCKIRVRQYILVAQASRWSREVVYAPVDRLHGDLVPIRRFWGEGENTVCCIAEKDIEQDSAPIYQTAEVSQVPLWEQAHGVALLTSRSKDGFDYMAGDKFWICIGASTRDYKYTAPVINLRTCQQGIINIDQVHWFPTWQGPDGELWTLGGQQRKLKLKGSTTPKVFSWAICQRLNAASLKISLSTKDVEISAQDAEMNDRRQLRQPESLVLFDQINTLRFGTVPRVPLAVPTPIESWNKAPLASSVPLLPPRFALNRLAGRAGRKARSGSFEKPAKASPSLPLISREKGDMAALWRIIGYARQQKPCNPKSPSTGQIIIVDNETDDSDTEEISSNIANTEVELEKMETDVGNDDLYLEIPGDSHHNGFINRPAFSPTDPQIVSGEKDIYAICGVKNPRYNPLVDNLCKSNLPRCQYNTFATCSHFHSPADKCRNKEPDHQHCISIWGALPAQAGECLMQTKHKCCRWDSKDLEGITLYPRRDPRRVKVEEAKRLGQKLHDMSGWTRKRKGIGSVVSVDLVENEIDEPGRILCRDLRDEEIQNLDVDVILQNIAEEEELERSLELRRRAAHKSKTRSYLKRRWTTII